MPKPPGAVRLRVTVAPLPAALRACRAHHRHLPRVLGGLVALEVRRADRPDPQPPLVGPDLGEPCAWGIIGRPVARELDGSGWAELTRSIVPDGAPPGCASAILGAAARWARAQGRPLVTYTLAHEPGVSLRAAGWVEMTSPHDRRTPSQWGCPSRARAVRAAAIAAPKRRWVPPWALPAAIARGWAVVDRAPEVASA